VSVPSSIAADRDHLDCWLAAGVARGVNGKAEDGITVV